MSENVDLERVEWLRDMQRVRLGPGDVLIVRLKQDVPEAVWAGLREAFAREFPNNQTVLLVGDIEVGVIEAGQADG